MHVFSTVLFVNGNPVGYKVFKQEGRLVLNPAENPTREVYPPAIFARNENGQWFVEGTNDQDLIDQVIEDVTMNEGRLPTSTLSAAP
jgi:hypothetical protein